MDKTICQLVEETLHESDISVVARNLKLIKVKAGKMEDRLLAYCNAIEDLGFKRVNRDYNKQ